MKSTVYTLEDDAIGVPLTIEAELIEWNDETLPDIVINEISYNEKTLTLWAFQGTYIEHLKDRIFQTWCQEI